MFNSTIAELKSARYCVENTYERYMRIREKATAIRAVRYDKDRVQTSNMSDLCDTVAPIIEAEEQYKAALDNYRTIKERFRNELKHAGFDEFQRSIWMYRYADERSLGQIAKTLNTTRSRVQYLLNRVPSYMTVAN